jgi:GH18 family chitinase
LFAGCLLGGRSAAAKKEKTPARKGSEFHVVAYLPDYRADAIDSSASSPLRFVTDLIYFSIAPTPTGALDLSHIRPDVLHRLREATRRTHTRLFTAVGGWTFSAGFAPMTADPAARARFEQALTRFCLDNKLDGVDFDWEQPDTPAQQEAYAALLTETERAFRLHRLGVTVALSPWYHLPKRALEAVDAVNLMSYDHEGRHATFADFKTDAAVFTAQDVPRRKIRLGLPFYGRSIQNRNQEATYADIVRQYHPAPSADEAGGLYFNGVRTIQQKTRYAVANGFGGVMIWELGQDTTDSASLLQAVHQALSPPRRR